MELNYLLKGIMIGLAIAAPVGPIGILCIQRTLRYGRKVGLMSGLGAATADGLYGLAAGLGLNILANFLVKYNGVLSFIGGLFLCYLGVSIFRSQPAEAASGIESKGVIHAYLTTLFLTITNPMTILSFAGILAGVGITEKADSMLVFIFVIGVFCGSALWWLLLSTIVSLFRDKLNFLGLKWVNRFSGLLILYLGLRVLKESYLLCRII
jgi:threonine/homoserine/homoserine lactone efflux protein